MRFALVLCVASGCAPPGESWDAEGSYSLTPECAAPPCASHDLAFGGRSGGPNEVESPEPFAEVHVDCFFTSPDGTWVGGAFVTDRPLVDPAVGGLVVGAAKNADGPYNERVVVLRNGVDYVVDAQQMQPGQAACTTFTIAPTSDGFHTEFDCPDLRTDVPGEPGSASAVGALTVRGCDSFSG